MSRQRSLFLTLLLVITPVPALAESNDLAGLVDIGGGRNMYLECRGTGVPAVVIVAGGKAAADDWTVSAPGVMNVFSAVAEFTRVCAYDRPGTPVGEAPSRSDPVAQPITAADSVADLHALLGAAGIATPVVLVGHSYGGLVVRLYAMTHPDEVAGMILVDALSEGLRTAETPDEWAIQRVLLEGDLTESLKLYPDLERGDADRSFDELLAAAPLEPMPLIVLSADRPWGPLVPGFIEAGLLPADVPPDFGYVTDRAQKEAQAKLAALVPGAKHITGTDSGHEIHKDQPRLVSDAIREVVDAVRDSKAWLVPRFEPAPCPKLQGAEALADASCGYLVVPENRSQATGRTIRLDGREIPWTLTGEAARSRCLSGWRTRRHRPMGRQPGRRRRIHPRPGHRADEPARHLALGTGAHLRVRRRLRQRASWPALLFRGNQARPPGGDGSLPPQTRRDRRRP